MNRFSKFLVVVVLAFFAACASDVEREFGQEVLRLQAVEPPTFLNADVAALFGKANFSARVGVETGMVGTRPPTHGELSGRDGSLFFIADDQRGKSGGLSALWDGATQTAYLLNEPLQGYAPMRHAGSTNVPVETEVVGEELLNGERCRKSVVVTPGSGNSRPTIVVWRALAHSDLPLRIQSTNSPTGVTLTLSRIRLQAPPAVLFALPSGFKRYESADAMLNELVRRKTDAVGARSRKTLERYGEPKEEDDRVLPPTGRPTNPY
jgi:hypothetical protein